ncbi:hypothetical protein [Nocardia donostiensis]|uniref:Uncharacterized protein n=1 Tax=Nocardia donostiensis TaxID=1538463 RepID=A0A1V2TK59_9NOCA|nr:hypothetical protein [Nocardia donostiensis]ONM49858.1 hypothetical protein B0T46_05575 [Nocardia donostiensis]OQS22192.1 hypothetical protein B0T44_05965 [Nocardia donostiensis]
MASLLTTPVITAEDASDRLRLSTSRAYTAIKRLHESGVIRPLTTRKRDQVWGAGLVLDELDALGARIKKAAT